MNFLAWEFKTEVDFFTALVTFLTCNKVYPVVCRLQHSEEIFIAGPPPFLLPAPELLALWGQQLWVSGISGTKDDLMGTFLSIEKMLYSSMEEREGRERVPIIFSVAEPKDPKL